MAMAPAAGLQARCPARHSAVGLARIARRLGAVLHPIVAHDTGNAQPIVAKHPLAATLLRLAVVLDIAPCRDGRLVAPEGERQELAVVDETLEALDADEAVD